MDHHKLVSIRIEHDLELPLNFREVASISMAEWDGETDSIWFLRLLAAIENSSNIRPEPPASFPSLSPAPSREKAQGLPRNRIIGAPWVGIAMAFVLLAAIGGLVISWDNDVDTTGAFHEFRAVRDDVGIRISWQAQLDSDDTNYQVEARHASEQPVTVTTLDSRNGQTKYIVFDKSRDARAGKEIFYRLVRKNAAGEELRTPWFSEKSSIR